MFANNNDGDVILSSRVVWEFTGACDVKVDTHGTTLGWVGIVSSLTVRLGSFFICCANLIIIARRRQSQLVETFALSPRPLRRRHPH